MASDGITTGKKTSVVVSVSPHTALVTLFFFLLILVCTTAKKEQNLSTSTLDTRRDINGDNLKAKAHPVPPPGRARSSSRPYPASYRSSARRRQRVFNASAHEVPSGPNPISNR
uniref:Uncharacterized protein n=1 Tax=Nelumbo nucifera TaxID=4432 RepID=A0A822ZD19_NELNU|nr:TPA_asm: hypothetical protein HUJ06_002334 [Nelumbo nucifera]